MILVENIFGDEIFLCHPIIADKNLFQPKEPPTLLLLQ
jgi:hypothetical protein